MFIRRSTLSNPISPAGSGLPNYFCYFDASSTACFCTEHHEPGQLLKDFDENNDFDYNADIANPGDTEINDDSTFLIDEAIYIIPSFKQINSPEFIVLSIA